MLHMLRAVVRLVNIFNCLHMIGWSKMNERLPYITLNRLLFDVSVPQPPPLPSHI